MGLETISWKEFLYRHRREPGMILDLRSREEYRNAHCPGALSLPYEEWEALRPTMPRCAPVYLYCERGNTALAVARELAAEGYWAVAIMGGYPVSKENP